MVSSFFSLPFDDFRVDFKEFMVEKGAKTADKRKHYAFLKG